MAQAGVVACCCVCHVCQAASVRTLIAMRRTAAQVDPKPGRPCGSSHPCQGVALDLDLDPVTLAYLEAGPQWEHRNCAAGQGRGLHCLALGCEP